jgi:pimeloyl-ACP methyl ester carboxylesterase
VLRCLIKPYTRVKNSRADLYSIQSKLQACRAFDSRKRLKEIKSPVLVISGSRDKVIKPTSAATLNGYIEGSQLMLVEGGSHMLFIEMPGTFNRAVLDFLLT